MLKVTYDGDKMVSRPLFTQEANKEATIKEIKELERPISNFKKKTTDNRKDSLDTLTFFQ